MSRFKKILYWLMCAFIASFIWNLLQIFGIGGGLPALLVFGPAFYFYNKLTTKAVKTNTVETKETTNEQSAVKQPITESQITEEPIHVADPITVPIQTEHAQTKNDINKKTNNVSTATIMCAIISVVSIAACIYFGIQKNNLQKKYDDLYDSTNKLASIALQMQDDVEEYEYLCDLIKNNYVGYRRSDFYATKPIIILEEGKTGFVDVYHYYLFGTCKIDYELIGSSASVKVLGHDDTGYAETVSYAIKWIEPGISYINFTNNSGNDVLTVIVISK